VAKRILVVRDDSSLCDLFAHALLLDGCQVQNAGDGLAALRLIDSNPPDVIVLDLGLPVVSGEAVRREIAAQPHARHISIVVVTGQPGERDDLQIASILRKPVTPERLVEEVRTGGTISASLP
jgi:two-component system response regulator MprA